MPTVDLSVVPRTSAVAGRRQDEPVAFGLPFPRAAVYAVDGCRWVDGAGRTSPVQAEVRERWADGSVRWAWLNGRVSWDGTASAIRLETGAPAPPFPPVVLSVSEVDDAVTVDTGVTRFTISRHGTFPFARVLDHAGTDVIDASASGLFADDRAGAAVPVRVTRVTVESAGPLAAAVAWHGILDVAGHPGGVQVDGRAEFFAGLPSTKLSLTVRNPLPAVHAGNFWELGDPASVLLRGLRLELALAAGVESVSCSVQPGEPLADRDLPFSLYQESSGGPHWDSPVHVNRDGRVVQTLPGYRLSSGAHVEHGRRATPVVRASSGRTRVTAAVPGFWENCPRAVSASTAGLRLSFWPAEFPDLHELQGGEQKTHVCWLAFGDDPVTAVPLDWCRQPALVHAAPAWYAAAEATPHLTPETADSDSVYRSFVRAAIEGADTFVDKRERIDEYGWRHFGELYADHESAFAPPDRPLVSHYNNQYDAIGGFAQQFFRSGDARWWVLMDDLAAHVVDIDLYHASGDKAAYSGGPFWHTCHYVDAGRSTHRAYPNAPGVSGGGPSNEHTYTGGLVLHYLLTGEARSKAAVLQVADWIVRIDDGRLSPFRFLARGDTGLASATREPSYHGPGRGAGHAIAALLDAYRLTAHEAYLGKAENLIRRCIHPEDDVAARGLLDAENRWSYTVFLQVLGRYLREQAEGGRLGAMYRWARESLLAYARWMAVHERPYLDHPGSLEHPTETWAAQDMRKVEVFLQASLHTADGDERGRFRARAAFFRDETLRTLGGMPTRTLTRPVVLLLANGASRAWFDERPLAALPGPSVGKEPFGPVVAFVPQRARAMVRACWIAGGIGAAALAGVMRLVL